MSFGIPVRNGLGVGLLASSSLATRNAFSPAALFAAGEQGAWYDPSDLTTLFQDTAGTVPVTTAGQSVARINDKSGRGNHATQTTAGSRPTYGIEPFGGRRNLLTYSQEFDNAAWTKSNVTVTANALASPDGTITAGKLEVVTSAGAQVYQTLTTLGNGSYTYSIYAKQGSGATDSNVFGARNNTTATNAALVSVNYLTGVVTQTVGAGATATDVGGGWWRITIPFTLVATVGDSIRFYVGNSGAAETAGEFCYSWGAQLETGSTATAYQRVTDRWNVTQAGVPSVSYLAFDGTDDSFITPTITPGTDKVQVFAGVRKLSDAATGIITEFSASLGANNGGFQLVGPLTGGTANYAFQSKGTVATVGSYTNAAVAAPVTSVITGLGDISGDRTTLRSNGVDVGQSTVDQGTGNYLAYPMYIGRRGGSSLPFNGRIYSLIVRFGANLTAGQISQTESWVNGKTGAY